MTKFVRQKQPWRSKIAGTTGSKSPLLLLGLAHPHPPNSRVVGPRSNHSQGILIASSVPAECEAQHETRVKTMAQRIAGALGHFDAYAVEFFVMPEGSAEPLMAVIGRTPSMSSKPVRSSRRPMVPPSVFQPASMSPYATEWLHHRYASRPGSRYFRIQLPRPE